MNSIKSNSCSQITARARLVRWILTGMLVCALGGLRPAIADEASVESRVKAAFLVKFGMFIEWPTAAFKADADQPFKIGILGENPFDSHFDEAVAQERVLGHPIKVVSGSKVEELDGCQIIYISASEANRYEEILDQLKGKSVLLVSDIAGFARSGGMVGFVKEGGKVRFEINQKAAAGAALKISAKLLQVGRTVSYVQTEGRPLI